MNKQEHERALSRARNSKYRANMTAEQKRNKARTAKKRREEKKKARLLLNPELFKEGKKICARCHNKKLLTEFSTKGIQPANYNDICDGCLIRLNKSNARYSDFMTEAFWRAKAYSVNKTAIARFKRMKICDDIQKLEYKATGVDIHTMYNSQDGKCFYCSGNLNELPLSIDHRIPLSREGKHEFSNLCLTCKDCNQLKMTRTDVEFKEFMKEYFIRLSTVIELADK